MEVAIVNVQLTDYDYLSKLQFYCSIYLDLLSSHIFESQCLVRKFAAKHYEASGVDEKEAKELARSCVSQRDIQVHMNGLVMLHLQMLVIFFHSLCRGSLPCMNGC